MMSIHKINKAVQTQKTRKVSKIDQSLTKKFLKVVWTALNNKGKLHFCNLP